jgi:hypothetical protein
MKMIKEGTYIITEDGGISFKGYTFDCAGDQAIDIDEAVRIIKKSGRPNSREL